MFFGCRLNNEINKGMIYFETTPKRISIHVFIIYAAQANIRIDNN